MTKHFKLKVNDQDIVLAKNGQPIKAIDLLERTVSRSSGKR
ncbi:MAG: hypothetical protein WBP74_03270 [Nitrososphaeraceae archaeon]